VRSGERVVMRDRRRDNTIDEAAVAARWGVAPASIPDYLALVGDSADGFPGLAGWGAKSAAAVLGRFEHLEAIPANVGEWHVDVRSPATLNATLRAGWADAILFRRLATLVKDVPLPSAIPTNCAGGVRAGPRSLPCATSSVSPGWPSAHTSGGIESIGRPRQSGPPTSPAPSIARGSTVSAPVLHCLRLPHLPARLRSGNHSDTNVAQPWKVPA